MRLRRVRSGVVAWGLILALTPLAAHAEDGNQAAIDAARADIQWMSTLTGPQQQVVLGQRRMANARAIAGMAPWNGHAQARVPNTMEQYRLMCASALANMQANQANAVAIAAARPWDAHAQSKVANANARLQALWDMIGDSYPGNPEYTVKVPAQGAIVSEYDEMLLADDEMLMADDQTVEAEGDETVLVAHDDSQGG